MAKSAAGTADEPGRNVTAKSGLNRAILDQGWYEMRRQLEYKQRWRGGEVLAVNPAYTSQNAPAVVYLEGKPSIAGHICLRGVWIRSEC